MESLSSKKVRWNKRIETPYKTKKDEWSTKVTRYTFVQSCLSSFRDPFVFNFLFLCVLLQKVLREHTGLLSELWDEIVLSQRHYLYHTWATSYIRWQFKVGCCVYPLSPIRVAYSLYCFYIRSSSISQHSIQPRTSSFQWYGPIRKSDRTIFLISCFPGLCESI